MTSLKVIEIIGFRAGLVLLVRGGWFWNSAFLLEGVVSLLYTYRNRKKKVDEREVLEQLASFGNSLREGDAPAHAWIKARFTHYPAEFISPDAEHFTLEIFEKQFRLFEKKLLLEEELDAEFNASRFRMGIMKYLPILSMLILESFSGRKAETFLRVLCAAGLLINYHLASMIEKTS
ncbi:MAG: hypothetical protein GX260_08315 [Tissierellia bacterium]|jgi:hypothetical protein|nr:hypothetical protein [Tissierellia bacterium]